MAVYHGASRVKSVNAWGGNPSSDHTRVAIRSLQPAVYH